MIPDQTRKTGNCSLLFSQGSVSLPQALIDTDSVVCFGFPKRKTISENWHLCLKKKQKITPAGGGEGGHSRSKRISCSQQEIIQLLLSYHFINNFLKSSSKEFIEYKKNSSLKKQIN